LSRYLGIGQNRGAQADFLRVEGAEAVAVKACWVRLPASVFQA